MLSAAAAHHALRVLRLEQGEAVRLFDGHGGEYAGSIMRAERGEVAVAVDAHFDIEREAPLAITLVQALQAGDRMDMTIQKAVELGVTAIVPVYSRRSLVRLDPARAARRVGHWRQVVASACEQCGRNRLPQVAEIDSLEHWLARPASAALRLFLSPQAERGLAALAAPASLELLVGPEGGLVADEAAAAALAGYVPVRLGPRVLRTETAGMAALAAVQARWGDFV